MVMQCPPRRLASLACSLLLHPLLQAQPVILATLTFRGEDPAILHVLGEGFGLGTSQVRVDFNGRPCPFWVLNDAHLVLVCAESASSSPRIDLQVLGQACQYPLSIPPLTVEADPAELLVPETLDPLAGRFNRAVAAGFSQSLVTGKVAVAGQGTRGVAAAAAASSAGAAAAALPGHGLQRYSALPTLRLEGTRTLVLNGIAVKVSLEAFNILRLLAAQPGKMATVSFLTTALFNPDGPGALNKVRNKIHELRKVLEENPEEHKVLMRVALPGNAQNGAAMIAYQLKVLDLTPGARNDAMEEPPLLPSTLALGPIAGEVTINGKQHLLSVRHYGLLTLLAGRPSKAATGAWLLAQIQKAEPGCSQKKLGDRIHQLRLHIEPDPHRPVILLTVRNLEGSGQPGYRLNVKPDAPPGQQPRPAGPDSEIGHF